MYANQKCENKEDHPPFIPQIHQNLVFDYFINSKHKGLALYHALGSGKTSSSIKIADYYAKLKRIKYIYVIGPATLRQTFIDEYCKVSGENHRIMYNKFVFVSYNYSGIVKKLPATFDDSLIIVDEAHNLLSGKRNNSPTFSTIYDMIEDSKNSRVLLLTGTVFKKYKDMPFLVNLLRDDRKIKIIRDEYDNYDGDLTMAKYLKREAIEVEGNAEEILVPENPEKFKKIFFDGIISYIAGFSSAEYPKRINMPLQKVDMSNLQTDLYKRARKWEMGMLNNKPDEALRRREPKEYAEMIGLYQVALKNTKSRAVSNFIYPEKVEINGIEHLFRKNIEKDVEGESISSDGKEEFKTEIPDHTLEKGGWISREILKGKLSSLYSSKIYKILQNILENFNEKHVIYSELKTRSGVNLIEAILNMCGIKTLMYSGDISHKNRKKNLKLFNDVNNINGQKYKVLLLTKSGAEGITLKCVKNLHILEQDQLSVLQQVIGRVIRYKSHSDLPQDERFARIYNYFSIPLGYKNGGDEGIDMKIYVSGIVQERQKEVFYKLLQESSIDKIYGTK